MKKQSLPQLVSNSPSRQASPISRSRDRKGIRQRSSLSEDRQSNLSLPPSQNRKLQTYKDGKWSHQEHELFERGLGLFGKDWIKIAEVVKSRSSSQVRSHAQKYLYRLQKEQSKVIPEGLLSSQRAMRVRNQKGKVRNENISRLQTTFKHKKKTSLHSSKRMSIKQTVKKSKVVNKVQNEKRPFKPPQNEKLPYENDREVLAKYQHNSGQEQARRDQQYLNRENRERMSEEVHPLHSYNFDNYIPLSLIRNNSACEIMSSFPGQIMLPIPFFMQHIYPLLHGIQNNLSSLIDNGVRHRPQQSLGRQQQEQHQLYELQRMRNLQAVQQMQEQMQRLRPQQEILSRLKVPVFKKPSLDQEYYPLVSHRNINNIYNLRNKNSQNKMKEGRKVYPMPERINEEENYKFNAGQKFDFKYSKDNSAFKVCQKRRKEFN